MKQLKSFLSIMVVSFVVYAAPAFAADSKDVQVINTPDVNVVNMPDVRVVNTPDVNVLTMPDIRVANTPDVNVVNMPNVVVNVPTRTPFQQTVNTATTWNTNTVHLTLTPPWGQRLVIEHISAFAFMAPNEELSSFTVSTVVNSESATHIFSLPETAPGFTGSKTYAGGQSVRIYADEGALISFTKVAVDSGPSIGSASVTVSGYLISMTSPTLGP